MIKNSGHNFKSEFKESFMIWTYRKGKINIIGIKYSFRMHLIVTSQEESRLQLVHLLAVWVQF